MNKILMLMIGGGVGTVARYLISGGVYQSLNLRYPYGTMIVNLLGCFLIGLFIVLAEEKLLLNETMQFLLIIGFCGAFTTFSTFILESAQLIRDGQSLLALSNILLSVLLGFVVFRLGILTAELF